MYAFVGVPVFAAEESDCCVYDPTNSLPDWFEENLEGRFWFESVTPTSKCKPPANVVAISKYASYFNTPQKTSGACSASTEWKKYEAQMKVIHCYVVRDATDKIKSCVNEPKTTNLLQKSFYAVTKDAASIDRVILEESPCENVSACQTYLKAKTEAEAKLAALAEAKKKLGPGYETDWIEPWTKDECLSVNGMDGKPKYVWLPPKKDTDVKIGNYCFITPMRTDLEISIGEHTFVAGAAKYIIVAYKYAIGLAVLFAVVTIIYAGFQWMLSGIADKVQDAKDKMQSAVLGLLLILSAYTLLNTINPQLTQLRTPPMQAIKPTKFAADMDVACDPAAEKNSPEGCGKYGDGFYCKPTIFGFKEACGERMKSFVAVMSAPAAIALGGATLGWFSGFSKLNMGEQALEAAVEAATSDGSMMEKLKAAGSSLLTGGGTKGKVLRHTLVIAAAAGVISMIPEGQKPAFGYCVQGQYDKEDGMVCSYDSECQSRKCLISKITCGGQNYGVCTSGKPREPCSTENGKYGCTSGASCIMNGIGVNKVGISVGFCSDGTLGMACNESFGCKSGLECIKGYCRDAGFFDAEAGYVKKFAPGKPSCILATECLAESICSYNNKTCTTANVGIVGCLKPPSGDGTLPARFLQAAKAGALDQSYFQELNYAGTCVVQGGMYAAAQQGGVSKGTYCYANVRPYQGLLFGVVNAFKENYSVPAEWQNGVEIAAVGCANTDVCRVDLENSFKPALQKVSGGRMSAVGSCVTGPSDQERYQQAMSGGVFSVQGKAVWFTKDGKKLVVEYEDEKFKTIGLPGFTDLANILAQ